ncbi:ribulose-phosphate 3-epimerase [Desulfatitalea alkaliphila]|uniref:Ribulose-phosphate 3-epimerase n=1 Tax=Desulfatitalea alkaliphila TaxID=2929485 RepID=A0AA41R218_9BACT|nr:ribulose-phosphate 3-epimerase [Desulfatitalea alkaliphila]MCJ8500589.1 ribulose-phosphate 3-epimerase [Desulfatitalea alkaliphila]
MPLIAPSILSADFAQLGEEIRAVEAAGADWIHIDVMDGHFVPNITMGPLVVSAVRRVTTLPLDVHLMIANPDRFIEDFAKAGADYITVQVETTPHLHRTIHLIRDQGVKAGAVVNPGTSLNTLEWILDDLDLVLIMSVNPGFGGQAFIPGSLDKIDRLRALLAVREAKALIEVDGGVNGRTAGAVIAAGADVLVAGSAIFGTADYRQSIARLKNADPGD